MAKSSTDRIEKRVELKASVARVWRALTDYQQFGQWFGVNLQQPFRTGEPTRGNITHPGYEHLVMEVVVEKMESERLFSFRWHPTAVDPDRDYTKDPATLVEFKLTAVGDGTLLVVTESGFDALPAALRDEAFRRNEGGWTEQMKSIETYVTNNS